MSSEDEACYKFIDDIDNEFSDEEKENESRSVESVKAKTKPEQINKIVAFVKEHNEQLIDKSIYAEMWEALSKQLNTLGPPSHSLGKWKRIWSVYKYNNRNRLHLILGDSSSREGDTSTVHTALAQNSSIDTFHNNVLSSLNLVLDQQRTIIQKLDKQEGVLEDISKKL